MATLVSSFTSITDPVHQQLASMATGPLYVTSAGRDFLWEMYLDAFPEELKQEHTCNTCRQFIKTAGALVSINPDLSLNTVWDQAVDLPGVLGKVAKQMREVVLSFPIDRLFVTPEWKVGNQSNLAATPTGTIRWHHFYYDFKAPHFNPSPGAVISEARAKKDVFQRSLEELTINATETVLDLIKQKSLYRGEEYQSVLEEFLACQKEYKDLEPSLKANYCWLYSATKPRISRMRNSPIGTLLIDLSEDMALDTAVFRFEKVMDPTQFKNPRAIATPKMIEEARQEFQRLGLEACLQRRYATPDDVTVNNVLFVNRDKPAGTEDIFEALKGDALVNPRTFTRVQEVTIEQLLNDVLPGAYQLEILMEARHESHLMAMVAPVNMDAPTMFKWDNGYTWFYNGALADSSIKRKVEAAGGLTTGKLRISLAWFNYDDLDLHLVGPEGHICHSRKRIGAGALDVDMNAGGASSRTPVENIIFADRLPPGNYHAYVDQFNKRENKDVGFQAEIEHGPELYNYSYPNPVSGHVTIARFTVAKDGALTFTKQLEGTSTVVNKTLWGLSTNRFQPVQMLTYSPNHWGGAVGNKHYFFFIPGTTPEGLARPFMNEFVQDSLLRDHKRVIQILGEKLPVLGEPQLCGLGFSSTSGASFYCRVTGSFSRILKVNV